jgi:phage repressor protein C with HTH and peptisase S24 domain
MAAASRRIGKNHSYLQQFIKRGVPAWLPEDVRAALAALLDVEEHELRGTRPASDVLARRNELVHPNVVQVGTVPVYGQAEANKDGGFSLGHKITDIAAPPNLVGVADAYAVYVPGESMEPRYFAGEIVFVNPRLPVRPGDFVVAQFSTGVNPPTVYVKRFRSRDHRRTLLEQFKPSKHLDLPASTTLSIHRIVWSTEG